MSRFLAFFQAMSPSQKEYMAKRLDCSVSNISRVAHGSDKISATKAQRFSAAGAHLRKLDPSLPVFTVADLVDVCARCNYFKQCKEVSK